MSNNLGHFIKKYRNKQSLRTFASKCGISHTHLDSIEKGIDPRTGKPVRITIDTLSKIAKAMNLSINELLIASGEATQEELLDIKKYQYIDRIIDDMDDDDIIILELLKDMDKSKKQSIINFIKTFK